MSDMQNRVNEVQSLYKKWLQLHAKLQESEALWDEAMAVSTKLEDFYFNGEYREIFDAIEEGENIDLTTEGEYSVMSEDALWNAFHEKQDLLWKTMRRAMDGLDPQKQDYGCDEDCDCDAHQESRS